MEDKSTRARWFFSEISTEVCSC